eukprot:TRINITY_DN569_c0_g1_i10.p1 TRINITY_DN569_c0_g1~~TRINITY_DN569_c0_g1_i10.p1  ORF type:complete len:397 (+),score=186.20 TRINITY_DN569_c0_g1_i10:87-1193(+)
MPAAVKPWIAEYVFCCGKDTYSDLRSKYMTVTNMKIEEATPEKLKVWNFDGSSTGQAAGETSEVLIRPVAVYPHPFLRNARAVLAECLLPDGTPHPTNTRHLANKWFEEHKADEPWFGLEQEYFLYKDGRPLGWPQGGFPEPQGDYYCGNSSKVVGRELVLKHYEACLRMGLTISGVNAEVAPAQWEFQIGPCVGIDEGDHMIMARWVWAKIAEEHQIQVNYDPKPIKGDWNGSGCHINFSTKAMREAGGYEAIKKACENLSKTFLDDVKFYGGQNDQRMTGAHETSKLSEFTYSVGGRHTSVRIGNDVPKDGKGYMEDRRPASNIDPYLSTVRMYTSAMGYKGPTPEEASLAPEPWWDELAREAGVQ